ncbi:hypothetical protein RclHR1_04930009 [Rhizophagus clarus]|uniref:BTB/POZ domain-containing protein n=1 Tax=Rhizophagus clarus TaxID=94130 RepID=A0A2Z6S2V2_9GLOM|nr:hypothetical protein RclHR1_04930009 [Rhizophagus clarus]GES84938.1 BTB/POZ domain-containing protein [Rhizophagus clarus]
MSYKYGQGILNHLENLFFAETRYDVIIYAGENKNIKELHAHSTILCIRSQYFRTAFSNNLIEKKDEKFIFKKPNFSPELFKIILRFIYSGKVNLTRLQGSKVLKLLIIANELNIQSLISCIQNHLIMNQDEFLKQNPVEILETIYNHSFTGLFNYFCKEPKILFETNKFINLKAPLLKLLLESDYLELDETFIWDSLLKWGLARNPSISQNITQWSNDDITIMKKTIHEFIPLIRFYRIPSDVFLEKVYPLKNLLPNGLAGSLITSNGKSNDDDILSTLIERQHFAIFASWIDKKEDIYYIEKNIPYKFKLLYCASKNNYSPAVFHVKCDKKDATLIVAKIKNSEQIIGGYNPLNWETSRRDVSTIDSFIYLFTDRKDIKTGKVGYSKGDQNSIENYPVNGPVFGNCLDLGCGNNGLWYNDFSSYSKIDGMTEGRFYMDDYEIFQVIKK